MRVVVTQYAHVVPRATKRLERIAQTATIRIGAAVAGRITRVLPLVRDSVSGAVLAGAAADVALVDHTIRLAVRFAIVRDDIEVAVLAGSQPYVFSGL